MDQLLIDSSYEKFFNFYVYILPGNESLSDRKLYGTLFDIFMNVNIGLDTLTENKVKDALVIKTTFSAQATDLLLRIKRSLLFAYPNTRQTVEDFSIGIHTLEEDLIAIQNLSYDTTFGYVPKENDFDSLQASYMWTTKIWDIPKRNR